MPIVIQPGALEPGARKFIDAVRHVFSAEHAELKQDQIHAYGPDPTIERCKGSMSAEIEPAE